MEINARNATVSESEGERVEEDSDSDSDWKKKIILWLSHMDNYIMLSYKGWHSFTANE